jgi:hypothetical protein
VWVRWLGSRVVVWTCDVACGGSVAGRCIVASFVAVSFVAVSFVVASWYVS